MKRAVLILLLTLFLVGVVFGCAGRFDLPVYWAWIAITVGATIIVAWKMDPELAKERMRPGPGGEDRHLRFTAGALWLAHVVVAALDVGRFHWSDSVPLALQILGLVLYVGSYALSASAVIANRFFSPVVRIQEERGHTVITDGPYRWIRHPGYAAVFAALPATGLALGSWWGCVPLAACVPFVLWRIVIEDRFLHRNLDGYAEYAQRVRYRLVPGVW
jgi:protein-S-isoprenylcysteine O-methyltransferase Ste14